MTSDIRSLLNAVMPSGPLWDPAVGGDFDLTLNGIAEALQIVIDRIDDMRVASYPLEVSSERLPDILREYGIAPQGALESTLRRDCDFLAGSIATLGRNVDIKNALIRVGAPEDGIVVEDGLPDPRSHWVAGNVQYWHHNHGTYTDPRDFLSVLSVTEAGSPDAMIGRPGAECRAAGLPPISGVVAAANIIYNEDGELMRPGPTEFEALRDGPCTIWIAEEIIRDNNGTIVAVVPFQIPVSRVEVFRRLVRRAIMREKPAHVWAYYFGIEVEG